MDERLRLTEEKKEQLLFRVKEALEEDVLDKTDWMKIYGILVEAHEREAAAVFEEYMVGKINGGEEE